MLDLKRGELCLVEGYDFPSTILGVRDSIEPRYLVLTPNLLVPHSDVPLGIPGFIAVPSDKISPLAENVVPDICLLVIAGSLLRADCEAFWVSLTLINDLVVQLSRLDAYLIRESRELAGSKQDPNKWLLRKLTALERQSEYTAVKSAFTTVANFAYELGWLIGVPDEPPAEAVAAVWRQCVAGQLADNLREISKVSLQESALGPDLKKCLDEWIQAHADAA